MGEKIQYRFNLVFLISLICCISTGCKKKNIEPAVDFKQIETQIFSQDWQERNEGVQSLLSAEQRSTKLNKNFQNKIILLFKDEVAHPKNFTSSYDENKYQSYMEDIVSLVVNQNLTNGIPLLFQYLLQGGSIFNDAAFMYLGEPSFNYLLEKATDGTKREQELAISQLSYWANPPQESDHVDVKSIPPFNEAQKQKLKPVLLKIFKSSDTELQYWSIRGLGVFQMDPQIKNELELAALHGATERIRTQANRILKGSK